VKSIEINLGTNIVWWGNGQPTRVQTNWDSLGVDSISAKWVLLVIFWQTVVKDRLYMLKDAWLPGEFMIDVKWQSDPDEQWSGAWREQDLLRASSMLTKQVLSGGVGIFLSVACCLEGNVGGLTRICVGLGMVEVATKPC
jgi:hypothetical protein